MKPEIFNYLFYDDRQFIMEITKVTANGESKWAVITRRNVPGYPPFRVDKFDTREKALVYYIEVVVDTPLTSLGGKSPSPRLTINE